MAAVDPYLKVMIARQARQLLLRHNLPPLLIFDRDQQALGQPIVGSQIRAALLQIVPAEQRPAFLTSGAINMLYSAEGTAFQVTSKPTDKGVEAVFTFAQGVPLDKPKPGKPAATPQGGSPSPQFEPLDQSQAKPVDEPQIVRPRTREVAPAKNVEPTPRAARKASVPEIKVQPQRAIDDFLLRMVENRASDLHLCAGRKPRFRVDGDLAEEAGEAIMEIDPLTKILFEVAPQGAREEYEKQGSCDFAYEIPGAARYRFNIYKEKRDISAAVRQIPSQIVTADDLGLPPVVRNLANLPKGLVLVTGPTGSGKSTTLAAIIDLVNRTRADHIITIESPIEFVHPDQKCLVHQREVGRHTPGFKEALRDALRQDPDVVLVGELRDLETISTAIETAATGHLVFGTLHTTTATSTVNRIIEIFPSDQQSQIRYMLAESLKAVIAQTLLKRKGGGRLAALEILMVTISVANLIREAKTHQIFNLMQTGKAQGMQLLNDELLRLVLSGAVEPLEAYKKAVDKGELARQYERQGIAFNTPGEGEASRE